MRNSAFRGKCVHVHSPKGEVKCVSQPFRDHKFHFISRQVDVHIMNNLYFYQLHAATKLTDHFFLQIKTYTQCCR